jgi:lysophospholipase L1-like esterase
MMQGKASRSLRIVAPIALALALVGLFTPAAFAARLSPSSNVTRIGPKSYYLALGDSLAFGYQPGVNWYKGYTDDFSSYLKTNHGVTSYVNMSCPGENTTTMLDAGCLWPSLLRDYFYTDSQVQAAVDFLHQHAGQVSPVTLDMGANDILPDITESSCTISSTWESDLQTMDTNMTQSILPQLIAALTVNGQITGDLLVIDYYDPYQNVCPNTVPYFQELNAHLVADAAAFSNAVVFVDVFASFGGAATPNPNTCNYTWICAVNDIHATTAGYQVMANDIEQAAGY